MCRTSAPAVAALSRDPRLARLDRTYRGALDGMLCTTTRHGAAYTEAARRATNVAERDHLVRQAARARAAAS
ncbi:MAG: hypothetical protein ACRDP9_14850 [Kribbellaceae bacterium]